mmetsp:Transcript_36485/g.88422  ORF Transcript_36485/g.88422 Transcript_36485/m.88422 type:complete len:539 (+) Transcript_36485:40-1656(+)
MSLIQPPEIFSIHGTLQTTISLEYGTVNIGNSNMELQSRLFNGGFPGPTLRIKPGDTLKINFENNLESQGPGYVHNQYSAADESNLHFHGLHVSGELPSDDATYFVEPGEFYNYSTTLPDYHMPGTFWMHPHRHGSTTLQIGGGALSAIIVEDEPGSLPQEVEDATEIILVAHYMNIGEFAAITRASNDPLFSMTNSLPGEFIMVNGQINPIISTRAGEWMRFRVIWNNFFEGSLNMRVDGCEMQLLAKDGIYIRDFPRPIGFAPIVPGGRADIMVRCPEPSKTYNILGLGSRMASIVTTSDPAVDSKTLEQWAPDYPEYLTDLRGVAASPGCGCTTQMFGNSVNNLPFATNQILHTSYIGAVVERTLAVNDHPYHQHVYPYQLVSGFDGGYDQIGDWHDTVIGNGVIRYVPTEYTGKIMVHCHRLIHEDLGMMATENVTSSGTCTCTPPVDFTAAIVGGSVALVVVIGLAVYCCIRRRRLRRERQEASTEETEAPAENKIRDLTAEDSNGSSESNDVEPGAATNFSGSPAGFETVAL